MDGHRLIATEFIEGRRCASGSKSAVHTSLQRIAKRLDSIGVPYAVVGGNAVASWVATVDEGAVRVGGHISLIAGRGAALHCWPKVSDWLASRS